MGMSGIAPVLAGAHLGESQGGTTMSWISPELIEILLTILKAVVILLVVVTCGAFMSFGERRLLGLFQNRYGPNRVGWGGSLQLVADMIKMFFKEDWIPKFSDRVIFTLALMIAFTSLLLAFAIVPVSPGWVVADLNIGILFFLMMAGLAVYAVLFAGWSSNNKYSSLGAMRASAQTLSYEVFLGLSLMGVVAQAGSFNMTDIVNSQAHVWNVIPQFFGLLPLPSRAWRYVTVTRSTSRKPSRNWRMVTTLNIPV